MAKAAKGNVYQEKELNVEQTKQMQALEDAGFSRREAKLMVVLAPFSSDGIESDDLLEYFKDDFEFQGIEDKGIMNRLNSSMRSLRKKDVNLPFVKRKNRASGGGDVSKANDVLAKLGCDVKAVSKQIKDNREAMAEKMARKK